VKKKIGMRLLYKIFYYGLQQSCEARAARSRIIFLAVAGAASNVLFFLNFTLNKP
jgi:hypothetical protein